MIAIITGACLASFLTVLYVHLYFASMILSLYVWTVPATTTNLFSCSFKVFHFIKLQRCVGFESQDILGQVLVSSFKPLVIMMCVWDHCHVWKFFSCQASSKPFALTKPCISTSLPPCCYSGTPGQIHAGHNFIQTNFILVSSDLRMCRQY